MNQLIIVVHEIYDLHISFSWEFLHFRSFFLLFLSSSFFAWRQPSQSHNVSQLIQSNTSQALYLNILPTIDIFHFDAILMDCHNNFKIVAQNQLVSQVEKWLLKLIWSFPKRSWSIYQTMCNLLNFDFYVASCLGFELWHQFCIDTMISILFPLNSRNITGGLAEF